MKILSLDVKNIRGIKSIRIEPHGQNTVIFGPNGTGKSAVVDAIDFLLTGQISRLTGEGTKALSVKEHGCHIDSRENLKDTIVVANVQIDGKDIVMQRSVNKPATLKIDPKECKALVEPYLESASLGLHILSRREILRYITAEAGKRAKEIMSLLNLANIESLRATLVTIKNEAKDNFKHSESSFQITKTEVVQLLSLDSFSDEAALRKVNELRALLNGSTIPQLTPEAVKQSLVPSPFGIIEGALTKEQIENTAKDIRNLIEASGELSRKESDLRVLLEEALRDAKFKQTLLYEKLYDLGLSLVDVSETCPLCSRKWEIGDFRTFLEDKKKETEVSKEKQTRIDEISLFIKTKLDLLKKYVENCARAHKQFGLSSINDKELQDFLLVLGTWSDGMLRPLDTLEQGKWPRLSTQDVLRASFLDSKMLNPLEAALKELGDRLSLQQHSWDALTKMEDYWRRYQTALKEKEISETFKNRAEAALEHFEEARDSVLESIYDAIKGDFEEYYRIIHGDDEGKFKSKISQSGAELILEVDFFERGLFPPHALHSEGHQDSMGLCLFFALNNYLAKGTTKVVILDDVIMSIDSSHRRAVCQLLKKLGSDKQYIVTTHDSAWARQLKTEGIVSQKNMVHFANWNIDTGPISELEQDLWDRINEDLGKNDIPTAAHRLRRNAECFFENVCDLLMAEVPYKGHHRWELGDFAPAAISAYKEYLKKAKSNSGRPGQSEKIRELEELEKKATETIHRSQVEQWVINENVHYNKWEEFSKDDLEPVVQAFKELFSLFICSECNQMIFRMQAKGREPKDIVCCNCGKVHWNIQ